MAIAHILESKQGTPTLRSVFCQWVCMGKRRAKERGEDNFENPVQYDWWLPGIWGRSALISWNKGSMFCCAIHIQKEAERAEISITLQCFWKLRSHFGNFKLKLFTVSEQVLISHASSVTSWMTINNCWMDHHELLYRHSLFPEDEA